MPIIPEGATSLYEDSKEGGTTSPVIPEGATPLYGDTEQTSSFNPINPQAYNARFQSPEHQAAFEAQNPRGSAELKERLYGSSGASVQQSFLASLPRDPNFRAYSAEKAGLDVVGIDKKKRLIIRNPSTGDVAPLDGNFFRDKAGAIGQWVKPAAQLATMAVMDTVGTVASGGNPVAGAALASAAAGASDLVFQKAASDWVGEPMSAGHAAGETIGAGAGYSAFGAASWGAKGFAKMVQKAIPKLGDGAKEMIQGITQVKKEPLDFLWEEMKSLKPGEPIEKLIHDKYLSLDIPQKLARKAMYGAEDAPHTLENLVNNFQRNMRSTGGDPKKMQALHEMYKFNLGPEADEALMHELATRNASELLKPEAISEEGLSLLSDKVIDNLSYGESVASRYFSRVKNKVLSTQGGRPMDLKPIDNEFISMLKDFGHVESTKFGKTGPDIFAFNEDKLSKPAVELYKDFMNKLGYKVGSGLDGRTTIFERPKEISLAKLWKSVEDFQTRFDKALDPMKGSMTDAEAAPLSSFLGKLRELRNSVDKDLSKAQQMWSDLSETKRAFKMSRAQGLVGEKGMIQKFQEIAANASGKNETFGAAKTSALRNVLSTLDSYKFMKGRELLPLIDERVASAKLGNMMRNGSLDEAVNKFAATMQHSLPQTGNIASENAKESLKAIDNALPGDKKFLWETQRHLTNLAFNKPGSIYQARWLAMALTSMLGLTHLGPGTVMLGVGLASKIQKPQTFAKKIIPYLTGAGKAASQPSSPLHGAASYVGKQVFAQAGRRAGASTSSS